ncbi:hypothetical protein GCM10023238_00710 [Streptomyces heliomycini]
MNAVRDNPWLTLALGGLTAVLAVLVYRWVVGRTERRPVTELEPGRRRAALGRGTLIGVVMFGMVVTNLFTAGDYEVHGLGSPSGAVAVRLHGRRRRHRGTAVPRSPVPDSSRSTWAPGSRWR